MDEPEAPELIWSLSVQFVMPGGETLGIGPRTRSTPCTHAEAMELATRVVAEWWDEIAAKVPESVLYPPDITVIAIGKGEQTGMSLEHVPPRRSWLRRAMRR